MKDKILQRIKEYNVIALVAKLAHEFSDHYQNKLLCVAAGSYDSYLAPRYQGKSKKKGEIGFKVGICKKLVNSPSKLILSHL